MNRQNFFSGIYFPENAQELHELTNENLNTPYLDYVREQWIKKGGDPTKADEVAHQAIGFAIQKISEKPKKQQREEYISFLEKEAKKGNKEASRKLIEKTQKDYEQ